MRIVGGRFRGRRLAAPKTQDIRPTSDRMRESLFNRIAHHWPQKLDGSRVLDIFAGTGALGFEALSRGADFALFIEQGAEGRGLLRENIETLGLGGATKVFRRDATSPGDIGKMQPFDLVFADPPYGKGLGEVALMVLLRDSWLEPDALVILEEAEQTMPESVPGFETIDRHRTGASLHLYLRPDGSTQLGSEPGR